MHATASHANDSLVRAALADGGWLDSLGFWVWVLASAAPLAYAVPHEPGPPRLPFWIAAAAIAAFGLVIDLWLRTSRIRRERAWIAAFPLPFDTESYWTRLASTSGSSTLSLRVAIAAADVDAVVALLKGRPRIDDAYCSGTGELTIRSIHVPTRTSFKGTTTQRNGPLHRWLRRTALPALLEANARSPIHAITTER